MNIALDATYSVGENLSGVGVYSRQILFGLAAAHPDAEFSLCFRPHRFLASFRMRVPANCHRRLLGESWADRAADVFHGLNQRLPRKARLRRAVSTFHDLFVLTGDYSTGEFRRRFALQAREAAARSDLILCVSQFTAGQVKELLGVEQARLRVAPHGVRVPDTPPPPLASREKIVLHVGAIQRRKNIARLVAAFEHLDPEWRLVLAGSMGFGAEEILARIGNSPRRDRIDVLGYVDDQALQSLYRRAAVFAFPSLDEGFGMPVLEAMAAGVPVLTSNRSALVEAAGDAAILVDPYDTGAIIDGLRDLATNEDLALGFLERGLARARMFSWKRAAEETWAVYQELLKR